MFTYVRTKKPLITLLHTALNMINGQLIHRHVLTTLCNIDIYTYQTQKQIFYAVVDETQKIV